MNLCINARDAMPGRRRPPHPHRGRAGRPGGAAAAAIAGPWVAVTVTDSGSGMPPDVVERVFEPFFTTKPDRAGTGLGLAVVFSIVRQHGGSVTCRSDVGQGTTFRLLLPVAREHDAHVPAARLQPAHTAPAASSSPTTTSTSARRSAASSTAPATRRWPSPTATRRAPRCATEPFDLAFLDVVMPGPTCHDLVARLRAIRPDLRAAAVERLRRRGRDPAPRPRAVQRPAGEAVRVRRADAGDPRRHGRRRRPRCPGRDRCRLKP